MEELQPLPGLATGRPSALSVLAALPDAPLPACALGTRALAAGGALAAAARRLEEALLAPGAPLGADGAAAFADAVLAALAPRASAPQAAQPPTPRMAPSRGAAAAEAPPAPKSAAPTAPPTAPRPSASAASAASAAVWLPTPAQLAGAAGAGRELAEGEALPLSLLRRLAHA